MRPALFQPGRAARAGTLPGLAAAAVAVALAGSPVSLDAAPPVGIGTLAREMSPAIARCLIRREPALVEAWLRTLPGSLEEARLVRGGEARFPACFDRWGHMQGGWIPQYDTAGMRAGLVRTLLQSRRHLLPANPPPGSGLPWYSPKPGDAADAIVAADLGTCLARKHWSNAVAIVAAVDPGVEHIYSESRKAKAARKREAAAVDSELRRIIPSIAGCVPAGARLRIERHRLRTLLEEAVYQMTNGRAPV